VLDTVPRYVDSHPELRIALLHLDLDVYEPTAVALEHLWDRVVPGGLVVIDDYGTVAGATRAVEELTIANDCELLKLLYSHVPAFIVR
jgi:hypothetical protein